MRHLVDPRPAAAARPPGSGTGGHRPRPREGNLQRDCKSRPCQHARAAIRRPAFRALRPPTDLARGLLRMG